MGLASAIGGALAVGGAIIGGKSQNKAAKKAAQTSAENNAQNVALQREIYGKNQQALSPFMQRGNAAGDAINALLGLGGSQPAQQQQQVMPNALSQFRDSRFGGFRGLDALGAGYGIADGQAGLGGPAMINAGPAAQTGNVTTSALGAQNAAFDNFRNSTGYQFRLGEGMNALNSGYAGAGVLQSGDAMRSAVEYGQNFASGEFGNYMNLLANQQGVGLSGASALAGVGQNYANNVTAMNTQNANNQANAALARTNPFANALGMIGGGLFNYGMGKI